MMTNLQAIRAEMQAIVEDKDLASSEKKDLLREIISEAENFLYNVED
jgi:hypothetical protein